MGLARRSSAGCPQPLALAALSVFVLSAAVARTRRVRDIASDEWDMQPLEPGPGDEYLGGFRPEERFDTPQRRAIRDLRQILAATRPEFVRPSDTRTEPGDYADVLITIPHAADPRCSIRIWFGDGRLAARWPGFHGTLGAWDWGPEIGQLVAALLNGENRQVRSFKLGRLVSCETEAWSKDRAWTKSVKCRPIRTLPLRLVPLAATTKVVSISFNRRECVVAD